jgi:hypothetical protein
MSSRDREAPSQHAIDSGVPLGEGAHDVLANENASAFVESWPDGDPNLFARALARVLVRQALREQRAISSNDAPDPIALAG